MDKLESREYYADLLKRVSQKKEMTLNDYAEMWYYENNGIIPDRSTQMWKDMFREYMSLGFTPLNK